MLSVIQPTPAMGGGPFQRAAMGPPPLAQAPFPNLPAGYFCGPSRVQVSREDPRSQRSFSTDSLVSSTSQATPSRGSSSKVGPQCSVGGMMDASLIPGPLGYMGAPADVPHWTSAMMRLHGSGPGWPPGAYGPRAPVSQHDMLVMKHYQQMHQQQQQQQRQQQRQMLPQQRLPRAPPKEANKDFSKPLFVDCSIEYDLPNAPKIPKNSDPILMIHPAYSQKLVSSMKSGPSRSRVGTQLPPANLLVRGLPGPPMRPGGASNGVVCTLKNCQCHMVASRAMSNTMLQQEMLLQQQAVKRTYASMQQQQQQQRQQQQQPQHPYLKPQPGLFFPSSTTGVMEKPRSSSSSQEIQPPSAKRSRVQIPEESSTARSIAPALTLPMQVNPVPSFWHPPTPHPSNFTTPNPGTFWAAPGPPRAGTVVHHPVTHITPPQSTCDMYHQKQWERHSRYLAAVAAATQQQQAQQQQQQQQAQQQQQQQQAQRALSRQLAAPSPAPGPEARPVVHAGPAATCQSCADGKCDEKQWNKENHLGIMRSL